MQNIQEAGFTGIVIVVGFVVGLWLLMRGRLNNVMPWAVGLLAVGQVGQSIAQRAVADAVIQLKSCGGVELLAEGCAEASANLMLAGGCALSLLIVAWAKRTAAD